MRQQELSKLEKDLVVARGRINEQTLLHKKLQGFREEYYNRWKVENQVFEHGPTLNNDREFLSRLEKAITHQGRIVQVHQKKFNEVRAEWLKQKEKNEAFKEYLHTLKKRELIIQTKKQQNEIDQLVADRFGRMADKDLDN